MKSLFVLATVLFTAQTYAVNTANCPPNISLNYSQIKLGKTSEEVIKEIYNESDGPKVFAGILETFEKLKLTEQVARTFNLSSKRNGQCKYSGKNMERVWVYTKKGKDQLYLQTEIGPRGTLLRTYAQVISLSPTEITLSETGGVSLAIPRTPYTSYCAGGPLVFVGKAFQIGASVILPQTVPPERQ